MTKVDQYRQQLGSMADAEIPAFLTANSNLPGPRGNLSLLEAFARDPRPRLAMELARSEDEFLAASGTAALGPLLAGPDRSKPATESAADREAVLDLLAQRAADDRWRVREGAAMAVQYLFDVDPAAARDLAERWLTSPDPLVLRAAIAGLCEPRLFGDEQTAALALRACQQATDALAATPPDRRRDGDVRVLRQALAYCWSVAVAGSPEAGMPAFGALDTSDPDVAWLVRENRKKKRLASLLP